MNFRKVIKILKEFFVCPKVFDSDFQNILRYLFALGFYQRELTLARSIYGFIMIFFLLISYVLGCYKEVFNRIVVNNSTEIFTYSYYSAFVTLIVVQTFWFICNQKRFENICHNFKKLDRLANGKLDPKYRNISLKLFKFYINYARVILINYSIANYFLLHHSHLIVPALYDRFAEGSLFYPFYFINFCQICLSGHGYACIEMLPVACIFRLEAHLDCLMKMIQNCTNHNNNFRMNEDALTECIKYHIQLLK